MPAERKRLVTAEGVRQVNSSVASEGGDSRVEYGGGAGGILTASSAWWGQFNVLLIKPGTLLHSHGQTPFSLFRSTEQSPPVVQNTLVGSCRYSLLVLNRNAEYLCKPGYTTRWHIDCVTSSSCFVSVGRMQNSCIGLTYVNRCRKFCAMDRSNVMGILQK